MAKTTKKQTTKTDGTPLHLSKDSQDFYRAAIARYEFNPHHLLLLAKALEAFDNTEK